ncbi:MAG: tripartite tricarboxylate transporter TctB family protein [bacterium]
MGKKDKDIYTALIMLLLSGAIITQIWRSPVVQDSSGPGPFFIPTIVALMIGGLSLALLIQSLKLAPRKEDYPPEKRIWNRLIWIMAWCFIYAITIEKMGYLLSTGLVTFALLAYFNRRNWVLNIIFSLGTPISIYFLFDNLLKVPLPKGWFGF